MINLVCQFIIRKVILILLKYFIHTVQLAAAAAVHKSQCLVIMISSAIQTMKAVQVILISFGKP